MEKIKQLLTKRVENLKLLAKEKQNELESRYDADSVSFKKADLPGGLNLPSVLDDITGLEKEIENLKETGPTTEKDFNTRFDIIEERIEDMKPRRNNSEES